MNTKEKKSKLLPLSFGSKIGIGKTVLLQLIQKNTNNKGNFSLSTGTLFFNDLQMIKNKKKSF